MNPWDRPKALATQHGLTMRTDGKGHWRVTRAGCRLGVSIWPTSRRQFMRIDRARHNQQWNPEAVVSALMAQTPQPATPRHATARLPAVGVVGFDGGLVAWPEPAQEHLPWTIPKERDKPLALSDARLQSVVDGLFGAA